MSGAESSFPAHLPREFHTTRWSVVLACGNESATQRKMAIDELCRIYWYPVYAFIRRKGSTAYDARELTQSFFLTVLEKSFFEHANRNRGRLRSFLLRSVQNHVISAHRKKVVQGHDEFQQLDFDDGERRFQEEAIDTETPERLFERKWALTLVEQSLKRLEEETIAKFGESQSKLLIPLLNYARTKRGLGSLAEEMGITETALKVRVHRLRKRYREHLRGEVAATLGQGEDIDEELNRLFELL